MAPASTRRPLPRIVPAIPHRLSRAPPPARPITPEESNKGTVAQQEPDPAPKTAEEQQSDGAEEEHLLTPDSRTSATGKIAAGAPVLVHSPPSSQADALEAPADAPAADADASANGHANGVPATPHDEPKPVSNGVQRKLAVPAQLPPPFYPSGTQTPPADGSDAAQAQLHRHQLSAGAVEFRSANDSPVVPATPQDAEQDLHGQQQSLPRPPPGFAPPQYTPFFPGHSHHPSEVGVPWLQLPYVTAPPDAVYENGGDYQNPSFSAGPTAYPTSYDGQFPVRDSFTVNGTVASKDRPTSKAPYGEIKSCSDHGEDQHVVPYQNGTAPPGEHLDESPFELAAYLSTQFGNPEFADFILQIRSPESALVSVPVHGIVVVRSPVIAEAIRHSPAPSHRSRDSRRLIDVLATDPFATHESLEEAVKVLYGAPLLSAQNFLYGLAPYVHENEQASSSSDARRRMQQLLSYLAAARILQVPIMQARAVEIARLLLRWDTIDQVLRYCLQAGARARPRGEGSDSEDHFVAALLNYAIDFMAYTFPVDFKLATVAPEFQDMPRLPAFIESRSHSHNPRLSKIRFGDAPPEDNVQPSHATRVLSTVVLSLPLHLVDRLFNHRATASQIGWTSVIGFMRDVINERESRRQKALQSQQKSVQPAPIPVALLNNLYIEEYVEQLETSPLYPSGHRLAAKRVPGDV